MAKTIKRTGKALNISKGSEKVKIFKKLLNPTLTRKFANAFFGIEFRRVKVKHNTVGLKEEEYIENEDFNYQNNKQEGITYRLHLAWGLKIGYVIK